MTQQSRTASDDVRASPDVAELLEQYGCGPIRFTGTGDALYERHLLFDNVVDPTRRRPARALRGRRPLGAGRPLAALAAHRADLRPREPQARLLPVDGVPDRPLAGQQRHQPAARSGRRASRRRAEASTGRACSSRSPTPAWATAASAGSRPASSTRWRRCSSRPWATACATSTASSGRRSRTAGSTSSRTTGCAAPTRGRSPGPHETGRGQARTARSSCAAGACAPIPGRPSTLIGIPFDRPVVGYGGKTINTLRLWAAAAPDYFDFQEFSRGDFVGALAETLAAESLTRVLYPDDSTQHGPGAALRAGVLPGRLLAGRPRAPLPPQQRRLERACPTRSPSSSTTRIRRWPCPS